MAVSPEDSVVIRLYRGQTLVFSTTLYTYMTRAYVRELRAIIEQDLREANKCNDLYDLTMLDRNGEETISTFTAVYCEIGLNQPVNNFIETHFLTTSTCLLCSRIANQLAYLAWAAETVYLSKYIVYRDKDGKIGVYRETPRTISSDGVFAPFSCNSCILLENNSLFVRCNLLDWVKCYKFALRCITSI